MEELLVISGALFILVLSIVGMKIYRRRTDVLTGPYISNTDHRLIIPDKRTHRFDPATAERTRTRRPFQRGWNSDSRPPDARKGATGYSSSWGADYSKSVRRSDALTVVDRLEGW